MNRIINEKEIDTYKIKDLETIVENNEHIDKKTFKYSTYKGRSVINSKELSKTQIDTKKEQQSTAVLFYHSFNQHCLTSLYSVLYLTRNRLVVYLK